MILLKPKETIKREMFENGGLQSQSFVLWLLENFFDYEGLNYRELALYMVYSEISCLE